MNNEKAKNYITETFTALGNRTIKGSLIYLIRGGIFVNFLILSALFYGVFITYAEYAFLRIILIFKLLLIVLAFVIAWKRHKRFAYNWENVDDDLPNKPVRKTYKATLGGVSAGLIAAVGMNLFRGVDLMQISAMTFLIVLSVPITIMISYITGVFCYKLYLLCKHCPEFKNYI